MFGSKSSAFELVVRGPTVDDFDPVLVANVDDEAGLDFVVDTPHFQVRSASSES